MKHPLLSGPRSTLIACSDVRLRMRSQHCSPGRKRANRQPVHGSSVPFEWGRLVTFPRKWSEIPQTVMFHVKRRANGPRRTSLPGERASELLGGRRPAPRARPPQHRYVLTAASLTHRPYYPKLHRGFKRASWRDPPCTHCLLLHSRSRLAECRVSPAASRPVSRETFGSIHLPLHSGGRIAAPIRNVRPLGKAHSPRSAPLRAGSCRHLRAESSGPCPRLDSAVSPCSSSKAPHRTQLVEQWHLGFRRRKPFIRQAQQGT